MKPEDLSTVLFHRLAIVGFGHIGSSIARAVRQRGLVCDIVAIDADATARETIAKLGLADIVTDDVAEGVRDADLVIVATPISTYAALAPVIGANLKPGAILSDVGSVKVTASRALKPHVRAGAHLVLGHPVAGTENSGPQAGLADMFVGRWAILTPEADTDAEATAKLRTLWERMGSQVAEMSPEHHDKVLAITSHLPHLIAYTIVGTAVDLESSLQAEVIKFSAGGFRDFTRIAASDPTMWRDVFLNNREAVLEMLQRLNEDLSAMQRAIRRGEGDYLFERFTEARAIRRGVIAAKQV